MTDIVQVNQALANRAQSVAEMLLPNGHKDGHNWRAGSVEGEEGQSLAVCLKGHKIGRWKDFNRGDGGDMVDLWAAVHGLELSEAFVQARKWLGMEPPKPKFERRKTYTRPPKPRCSKPARLVFDYLRENRNLSAEAISAYRIGEDGNRIVFPFLLPDGELAMAKIREAVDGARPKPTAANCEPILFGWQAVPANAREVVLCEGEIDACSWFDYGYPALSVPFGGGDGDKQKWIENEFDRLARFERIYLAMDMDEPGEKAVAEIVSRLGRERCLRVKLPRKDGNECLVEGIGKPEIDACIAAAESMDPDGLCRPDALTGEVLHLFWPAPEEHVGYRMPYRNIGDKLLFRPGEITLWSGAAGAGKSQVLSDCAVDWVAQGSQICISSLEMRAAQSVKRMCKQITGTDRPTTWAIRQSIDWLTQGLLLYDRVGKADIKSLLAVFDYARAKYRCDQFVIDSFMRLGVGSEDYESQEKALFELVQWTIASNVHVHLVAHTRKGERGSVPQTEDVKGAMEIGANAFNIITIWRDRNHEEELRKAQDDDEREELEQKPGVVLNVAKQRNGDFEGRVGLWFDQQSYRYKSSKDNGFKRGYMANSEQSQQIVEAAE